MRAEPVPLSADAAAARTRPARGAGLAAVIALWAVASVLPLGAWTDVAERALYTDAWRLWLHAAALALLPAVVVCLAGGAPFVRGALGWAASTPRAVFLGVLGAAAAVEAALVAARCFARNPVHVDVWPQLFQAKIFLAGRLAAPPPPSVTHFATLNMLGNEAHGWFSQYPPIHALVLALGVAAGVPWLTTPLLAAVLPAAVWALGRGTGDERVARLAAALVTLSPFVVVIDASGLSGTASALLAAMGLAALPALARGGVRAAALVGAAVGLLLGLRPADAVALAVVTAGALLAAVRARRWRVLAAAGAAGTAALLPTLVFNGATTGNPFLYGYALVWGHALPWRVPFGEPLTPLRALGLTALDAHELNLYLLAWPIPVTLLAPVALRPGGSDAAPRPAAAFLVATVALLAVFFFRDTFGGPRYLFAAVPSVLVLVAAGIVRLADGTRRLLGRVSTGDAATVAFTAVALLSATLVVPQHLASMRKGGVLALHPADDARAAGVHHAVVLVPDGWGNRLVVRMWAAGVPVRDSPRLFRAFDACALEERLDAAEQAGLRGPALVARLDADAATADRGVAQPTVTPDPLTRLPSDPGAMTPRCRAEVLADRRGILDYAPFLWLNAPGLDGDVVWAREMGAGDGALRARYPDRRFFRYTLAPGAAAPTFTPLDPPASAAR
ncbi:MAG TPA: hypothetical protein VFD84_12555 [Candidatus Binatia bacterium]|nr:hypothetical protein [Candidatus Binatia bacterium]